VAVRVRGDDDAVARAIEFVAQDARQPVAPEHVVEFTVRRAGDGYAVAQDGRALDEERDARGVMESVFRHAHQEAFTALRGATLLRAAVGLVSGRRVLILGEPRSGVTALCVRLLQGGAGMEGDALCVVTDGEVTAFPRAFHLRNGIERVLPDLAPQLDGLPRLEGQAGDRIWAWRPDRAGFGWEVRQAPVDAVVVVEPNHGGDTRIREHPRYLTVQRVVRMAAARGPAGAVVAELTGIVGAADCHVLTLGEPGRSAIAMERALS
jgi:hypothetical protein